LVHEVQQAGGLSETTRAKLLSSQDARLKRATGLAKSYFQMDMATGRLTFLEEDSRAHAPIWLRQSVRGMSAQHGENAQVLHSPAGKPPRMFLASAARGPGGRDKVAGFEVDLPALTQWFGTALNRQPLVPPSLGHGKVTNAFVYVSIRDQGG